MPESRIQLGRRIRALRRARDLSQEQLAEKANLSHKYLGEIERGQKNVSVDVVEKISAALDVDIGELFDYQHEQPKSELKRRIGGLVARADEGQLRTILRVLKSILE